MQILQRSVDRVEAHTSAAVNDCIRRKTEDRIAYFEDHREEIPERLRALDREWDIERALETGSATLSLTGLMLGLVKDRRWLVLPLAVQSFFLLHALQGWCPPLPVLRRLGVRTMAEIENERDALRRLLHIRKHPSERLMKKLAKSSRIDAG